MIELKPCPFCGGKAKRKEYYYFGLGYAMIVCEKCESKTKEVQTSVSYAAMDKAVELWNRRADNAE